MRIIEAFNDAHPRLTASTASHRTGITRSAARRYLLTLQHLGYVESDGQHFWLTPKVLRLGWSYFDSAKVPRAAQPHLQRISVALGGAAFFAVLDEDDVVFVARDGFSQIQNVGFVLVRDYRPIWWRLLVWRCSLVIHRRRSITVDGRKFVAYTPHTATTETAVRENINNARNRGYALLEQQLTLAVRGIAVPIRKRTGEISGALSVSLWSADGQRNIGTRGGPCLAAVT